MGLCSLKDNRDSSTAVTCTQASIHLSDFELVKVVGRGGFGRVWQVRFPASDTTHALKQISKARVLAKNSVAAVMNERQLLVKIRHDFIVNLHYAFQDLEYLYLVMDLKLGGDLRYHLGKCKRFSETQTSTLHVEFFVACILEGLRYLHEQGLIHRDIKPENLVFDSSGYLHITDFGIARVWQPENGRETSGTPGYMAPEVMCRQNHGVAVDYFALGVLCYECMLGRRPYQGKSRREIRDVMLQKQASVQIEDMPAGWSMHAADFINRLLQRKPIQRLGRNGPDEVFAHPWLADVEWTKIRSKQLPAPFLPSHKDNFDPSVLSQSDPWSSANAEILKQQENALRLPQTQQLFAGYHSQPVQ